MLLWIIGFSLLGSVGSVAGAALFLFFPESIRKILVPVLDQLCDRHAAWCSLSWHDPG